MGEKNRLKAKRAWFLSGMERRAKPETEQLLTRWGKSCVFSESTGLSLYILAGRLCRLPSKAKIRRLNLQWSLMLFPKTSLNHEFENTYIIFK
ncbi:MAG: hypothetical protein WBC20_00180 [Candidatus Aminicenantaceae bacterium]